MSVPLSSLELKMASKYPKINENFSMLKTSDVPSTSAQNDNCCFACSNKTIFCFIIAIFFIIFINPYIIENLDKLIRNKLGFNIIGSDDVLSLQGMIIIGLFVFIICRILLFF